MDTVANKRYRFGPYTLDPAAHVLLDHDKTVEIQPKPFEILVLLVRAAGRMLLKEELVSEIWAGTFVEEGNLTRNISTLRKVLGDQDESYIETVPKRGYRFVAPVEVVQRSSPLIRIAVLPFAQIGEAQDGVLGFGIADSLIGTLSQAQSFAVRPTSAVLKYEDRSRTALEAGAELGVEYVVDGHIQSSADRLRVSVQLVEVQKGATVWAQKFDEAPAGIFLVQDAISERVSDMLARRLSSNERVLTRRGTDSADAYLAYVRGRYYLNKLTLGRNAIEQFARAIDLDPGYALAYAGLADAYYITCAPAGVRMDRRETVPRARAAVLKALDLDPGLAEAWQTWAMLRFWEDWDRSGAEADYRRAIELKPNCPHARYVYAWALVGLGRFRAAEEEARRALELDPLSAGIGTTLALPCYFGREYETAIARLADLDLEPYFWYRDYLLGLAYAESGRLSEAREVLSRAIERTEGLVVEARAALARVLALAGETALAERTAREAAASRPPYYGAYFFSAPYAALGDKAAAFEWLETALAEHDKWTAWLQVDPALDSLRCDARWPELVRKCGF